MKWLRSKPVFILALLVFAVANFLLALYTPRSESWQLFGLFGLAFLAYFYFIKIAKANEKSIHFLLIFSFAIRLVWVFAFPALSDDWARFIWDGRLLANGYNPFAHLPSELIHGNLPGAEIADPALLRAMNSPEYYTVYPPVLQSMFAAAAWLFPKSIYGAAVVLKLFILAFEIGTFALISQLLKIWKLPAKNVLLYALNPLVIAELSGNIHHEGMMLFFVLACLLFLHRKIIVLAAVFLALAVCTKLLPLMLLPLLVVYLGWKRGIFFSGVTGLVTGILLLPFLSGSLLTHGGQSTGLYFSSFQFNGSLFNVVRAGGHFVSQTADDHLISAGLGMFAFVMILVYSFSRKWNFPQRKMPIYFALVWSIYLFSGAIVHPWYLIPLLGFSIFSPIQFPWVWSLMILSSYYSYRNPEVSHSPFQILLEYAVVAVFIAFDYRRTHFYS